MRNTLAILGLVAASQALPTREKRQFFIGDGNVDFCVNNECSGSGLILTPSPRLPPGFTIPKKRSPQYDGPSKSHGGDKGDKDDKGGKGGKWGKPDDPWDPDAPSHPEEPAPPTPEDPPKKPPKPDYPEEEEPEYPEPDYPEPDYPEPDYPEPDYPEPDYPEPDYPEPDYPEPDYPEDDVSREDIIEAQQTLLLLQQVVLGVTDPEQKAAIQAAIDEAKEFLKEHAGITNISADPGVGTILIPEGKTRRSTEPGVDVEKLYDALVELLKSQNPTFPVYMVAEQLVQLLLEEGFEFDPTILGVWSKLAPKVKRQDGIFALPGTCGLEDIIGLETTLATILLIYGPDPPASISSLRNAVTAALLFCRNPPEIESEFTVENPVEGGQVVPEEPVEGNIVIEEPEEGSVELERPSQGPPVDFEGPDEGSTETERPTRGAPLEPEEPVDDADGEDDVEAEEGAESELRIDEPEESTLIVEEPVEGSVEIDEGEEGSVEVNEP